MVQLYHKMHENVPPTGVSYDCQSGHYNHVHLAGNKLLYVTLPQNRLPFENPAEGANMSEQL